MPKVGSRRTGGAGIDTSTLNGFLQFVSGSDPSVRVFASQAQAEAGTDNVTLMTPLRVAQAIAELADPAPVSIKLNQSVAPTAADNAGVNDDAGNPLRVGSYWVHVIDATPETESDIDWYELQAFAVNGDAIWRQTDELAADVVNAAISDLQADVAALQTTTTTLVSRMATTFANVFDSPALITVAANQRVIELSAVPKDNSTTLASQTSTDQGLFALIEDQDYELLGNLVFLNDADDDSRTVADGDIIDLSYVTNMFNPGDVNTPEIGAASGGTATLTWVDTESGGDLEVYKCEAANNADVIGNWSLLHTATESAGSYVASAITGDKFRVRLKDGSARKGVFSEILVAG